MKKFTKEEVCNILLSFNLKKYDDSEYLGANKSFYCINEEGYIAPVTLSNLQKGCPIRYFDKRNVYTIQNIKLFLSKYKPSVELTDGEYNGTHCKI